MKVIFDTNVRTGDKDLFALNPFKTAKILTPADFEKVMFV